MTMITGSSTGHSVLFKIAPARSCFPGIQDAGRSPLHGFNESGRECGDPGKTLHEVKRHSFAGQYGAGGTGNCQEWFSSRYPPTVWNMAEDFSLVRQFPEGSTGELDARENHWLARTHHRTSR